MRDSRRSAAMKEFILALDQGTTSSRAMLFDRDLRPCATAQQEFPQIYPQPGWAGIIEATISQSVGSDGLLTEVTVTNLGSLGIFGSTSPAVMS